MSVPPRTIKLAPRLKQTILIVYKGRKRNSPGAQDAESGYYLGYKVGTEKVMKEESERVTLTRSLLICLFLIRSVVIFVTMVQGVN